MSDTTESLRVVLAERQRQEEKWGADRDHNAVGWFYILMEEVGELAQAILDAAQLDPQGVSLLWKAADLGRRAKEGLEAVGPPVSRDVPEKITAGEAKETMQVAAVALAMMEWIDRRAAIALKETPPDVPARLS